MFLSVSPDRAEAPTGQLQFDPLLDAARGEGDGLIEHRRTVLILAHRPIIAGKGVGEAVGWRAPSSTDR